VTLKDVHDKEKRKRHRAAIGGRCWVSEREKTRTGEIRCAAGSGDGGPERRDERRGRADAFEVRLGAASGAKSSDSRCQLLIEDRISKVNYLRQDDIQLEKRWERTYSAGGKLRQVLSADERGGESQKSDFERNHFDW
jgi:hypothetical protein